MKEWEQFLSDLEQEFSPSIIAQWVRPLKVLKFDAANLYLEATDPMQLAWFQEHIAPRIKQKGFFNGNNRPIKVHIGSASKKSSFFTPNPVPLSFTSRSLDPACTFEHFSTSPGNLMAYKLFLELATMGSSFFNPIYLYGPKNCGKTHLLMACASVLSRSKHVFYTTADAFTDHVVQAIRASNMPNLRKTYRDIDVLIIDDIDRFSGRSATQEEFFHTFNALHTAGKQLILCSQFPPSKLQEIESRLISRFEWGIAVGMEKGDLSQILKQKALEWNFPLEEELLSFLLAKFPLDPVLALQALMMRSSTKEPIGAIAASHILKDLMAKELLQARTPEGVIKLVAAHYGLKREDIQGKGQTREIAIPRKVAMYVCRSVLKMSFQAIGKVFSRDHSTVMASIKQIQVELDSNNQEILEATTVASRVKD